MSDLFHIYDTVNFQQANVLHLFNSSFLLYEKNEIVDQKIQIIEEEDKIYFNIVLQTKYNDKLNFHDYVSFLLTFKVQELENDIVNVDYFDQHLETSGEISFEMPLTSDFYVEKTNDNVFNLIIYRRNKILKFRKSNYYFNVKFLIPDSYLLANSTVQSDPLGSTGPFDFEDDRITCSF